MVRCSVLGCKSDSETKIDGLSFHKFPEDPELRRLWVAATGRNNWLPKKRSTMCCKHFDRALLWKRGKKTYLYPNAAPIKEETEETHLSMEIYQCKTEPVEHASEEQNLPVLVKVESIESTSPTPTSIQQSETATLNQGLEEDEIVFEETEQTHVSMETYQCKTEPAEHASEERNLPVLVKVESIESTSPTPTSIQQSEAATLNQGSEEDEIIFTKLPDYSLQTWKRKWLKEKQTSLRRLKKLKALQSKTGRLTKKIESLEKVLMEILESKSHSV